MAWINGKPAKEDPYNEVRRDKAAAARRDKEQRRRELSAEIRAGESLPRTPAMDNYLASLRQQLKNLG